MGNAMGNDESVSLPVERPTDLVSPAPLDAYTLIAKAIDANVGIDTMERLIALRDRLKTEAAKEAFFSALATFQGECPVIVKQKLITIRPREGTPYSYKYAPLDDIMRQVSPLLEKHGFSFTIDTKQHEGQFTVLTELHHKAGHTKVTEFTGPIDKAARMNDTQKVGAARTFLLRYGVCNALGIITGDQDTDANGSEGKHVDDIPLPRRKLEQEAQDETDRQRPPGPSDTPRITTSQHRALESEITSFARLWKKDRDTERQRYKDRIGQEFGLETFTELTPAELKTVRAWISADAAAERKKGAR